MSSNSCRTISLQLFYSSTAVYVKEKYDYLNNYYDSVQYMLLITFKVISYLHQYRVSKQQKANHIFVECLCHNVWMRVRWRQNNGPKLLPIYNIYIYTNRINIVHYKLAYSAVAYAIIFHFGISFYTHNDVKIYIIIPLRASSLRTFSGM